jgi:hypothetical protein
MEAMVARAKPGVKEYELKAAAASAIMDGGGDIDFLIIGTTPMDNPALVFGNPRPSGRVLKTGDIVNMELAAGYRGYTAQVGSPITLGPPTDMVRKFWEEITLPGYHKIVAEMLPGKNAKAMQDASRFFRDKGVQSRPTQCHGIDIVTDNPHITADSATRSSSPTPAARWWTTSRWRSRWRDSAHPARRPGTGRASTRRSRPVAFIVLTEMQAARSSLLPGLTAH